MHRLFIFLILLLTSVWAGPAMARSFFNSSDTWKGEDKAKHFFVSVPLGAFGVQMVKEYEHRIAWGTMIGGIPGLSKEIFDGASPSGTGFSSQDLAYDLAGSWVGAMAWDRVGLAVLPSSKGIAVFATQSF